MPTDVFEWASIKREQRRREAESRKISSVYKHNHEAK